MVLVRALAAAGGIRRRAAGVLLALLVPVVFVVTGLLVPGYLSGYSLRSLLVLSAMLGFASVGQTITVVLGGLDLSIPALIAMADVSLATLVGRGWPFWQAAVLVLGVAAAVGAVNGLLSCWLQVPSLIVTLATGSVVTGGTLALDHGANGGVVPAWITSSVSMTSKTWFIPVPPIVAAWLLLAVLIVLAERRTMFAKRVFASGMNRTAARLALVREPTLWAAAFTISAVFAAVTGFLLSGFSGGADVSVGDPYTFLTVAAVVVGGTSLLGGTGSYWRTVVGAILITELSTLLLGVGFGTQTQLICLGILIVALVLLYGRQAHVSRQI